MKAFPLVLIMLIVFHTVNSTVQNKISIIPQPVSLKEHSGHFNLPQKIILSAPQGAEIEYVVSFLKARLSEPTGFVVIRVGTKYKLAHIRLVLNETHDSVLGDEGYTLNVTAKGAVVKANKPAGLFYGAQTLIQLLPPAIESETLIKNVSWMVPAVKITDYPRFSWRGMMLDVSRHIFTVDEIKRYIDDMSRYKYNMLHLHLTDDQGWRIEIKSLPKLTETGAWRPERMGPDDELKPYGGFYTHEQIRELVKYAREHFIDIMPEIDVPGHSRAAIASYPELSCTEGAENYGVSDGKPFMNWPNGAAFPPVATIDNTLCPANEKVYDFMDNVITEIAQLFPFKYIHVGGDEAPQNFWEKSTAVQELMKRENLNNYAQVQAYFGQRLEKIVESKGKMMMGWEEMMDGGVFLPNTSLMSWKGVEKGVEASKSGHYVVMSPIQSVYIDLMQGDVSTDPPNYKTVRLNQSYNFNPVPEGADAKYILGGQANLWTEEVCNFRQAQYMTWPRGFAVVDAVWSTGTKDWNEFIRRVENHFVRYDFAEKKYSRAMYDPIVKVLKQDDRFYISLTPEIEGLDIYTSFDNSEPDCFYPKYIGPQLIPQDASRMRIVSYRGKEKIGRMMTIMVEDLKKREK
ncbi:MAG: beta-N-acetylhexosaminidase [Paludibacter sp.]|nr:beta-N-acetylhexosaminidase [Paludibacter sp.]